MKEEETDEEGWMLQVRRWASWGAERESSTSSREDSMSASSMEYYY